MRGRKREPTADSRLELPDAPKELDSDGRREWDRVVKKLTGIDERDRAILFLYCAAWSTAAKASRALKRQKLVVTLHGAPAPNPWLTVLNAATRTVERNAAKLGLTPWSRNQIHASGSAKRKSQFDELLAGNETVKIRNVG